jgi:hypothetical protein
MRLDSIGAMAPAVRRHRCLAIAVTAVLALSPVLAGCGGEKNSSDEVQRATDDVTMSAAPSAVSFLCLSLLTDGSAPAAWEDASTAIDDLIDLARRDPGYTLDGVTARQAMADLASELDECGADDLARRLDRARESL